ncbi:DUF6843 domain-containing protein [Desertivirga arenae]|uniref:DUF6843 domain-containing protein n=1 Tax=Desertivirga arenae TaxID=2810309 RepID=UPI001A97B61F|nr:hypothetical protein [Pedobacter sp. SYSU D00823]
MKRTGNILVVALSVLFSGCNRVKVTKEIILIPQNFQGHILVIYHQKNGVEDSIVNRSIIYKIPADGVLLVKGEMYSTNLMLNEYYYYDLKTMKKEQLCSNFNTKTKNCIAKVYNHVAGQYQEKLDSELFDYSNIVVGTEVVKQEFDPERIPLLVKRKTLK